MLEKKWVSHVCNKLKIVRRDSSKNGPDSLLLLNFPFDKYIWLIIAIELLATPPSEDHVPNNRNVYVWLNGSLQ